VTHSTPAQEISGFVAPGFEGVAEAFERNFVEHDELGAAFSAVRGGETVVDLHGGIADRASRRPWTDDTLQLLFSGTKGFVAVCLLLLLERGQLELDAPVAHYWPEFGKPSVRVRDVVSHTARLPGLDTELGLDAVPDFERMAAVLAAQAQSDDPRAAFCYHALTYGWLCGELVRRADGRSVGRFFADEVAHPLGLELWIGLPEEQHLRVSTLELHERWPTKAHFSAKPAAGDRLTWSIWANPPTFGRDGFPWNRRDYHAAEIPGANAIGTARSVARLYGCLACGGEVDGVRLLSEDSVRLGRRELSRGWEAVVDAPMAFGVGFQLQTEEQPFGPAADGFGHGGAGGSKHGAWPALRVGFSYAMNMMRDDEELDGRAEALLRALHEAVA
jgi:CubicO group peptidase (beta-lactamase class C family)